MEKLFDAQGTPLPLGQGGATPGKVRALRAGESLAIEHEAPATPEVEYRRPANPKPERAALECVEERLGRARLPEDEAAGSSQPAFL